MKNKTGMKFDCIFEETLDFIDIDYTHLNKTIRYEQRQHGEWIPTTKVTPNFFSYKCSICGNFDYLHIHRYQNSYKYVLGRYCWACGADMRKEGEAE